MDDDLGSQLSAVGALADPGRRTLYDYVTSQREPVSRDQVAAALALPRHIAKFHLDRLVEAGLLDTEFRRLSGRRGPGAGRPSKLYRRSGRQIAVTLPERRYDLAGQILAEAVERAVEDDVPVLEAVCEAAAEEGRRIATSASAQLPSPLAETVRILAERGYEPRVEGDVVVLLNCPFDALARDHASLVCGMNLSLIGAFIQGRQYPLEAALHPAEHRCCVAVAAKT